MELNESGAPSGEPVEIGSLAKGEEQVLLALLKRCGLPEADVLRHAETALVARLRGGVVGSAVLELYGEEALLRSVAVAESLRGSGLGVRLTGAALDLAHRRGIRRVFLLTETAARFFPRFGFRSVERSQVPEAVQQSVEFRSACPQSALAMELKL
jgi:amino-acid N-acetyltransferase